VLVVLGGDGTMLQKDAAQSGHILSHFPGEP
jgi:hypothetical protein